MQVTLDYEKIANTVELMEASGYATSAILKSVRKISPKTALGRAWTRARLKSAIGNHKKRNQISPELREIIAAPVQIEHPQETHGIKAQDWEGNILAVMGMPLPLGVKKDIVKLLCFKEG